MTITFGDVDAFEDTSSGTTFSLGPRIIDDNTIVVAVVRWQNGGNPDAATASIADSLSRSGWQGPFYAQSGSGSSQVKMAAFYHLGGGEGDPYTATVTLSAARVGRWGYIYRLAKTGAVFADTPVAGNSATNTTAGAVAAMPSLNGDVLLAAFGNFDTTSLTAVASGFTDDSALPRLKSIHRAITTNGSYTPGVTFGDATAYAAIALRFTETEPVIAAPVISAATPTGTIGTTTTATLGCTTDKGSAGSNTLYAVRATTSIFSGVTAAQVKSGQNAAGNTTGVTASNGAVTSTSPSVAQSSLSASTTYYYALVQEDAVGLSNVLTGSFTTAALASAGITSVTGHAADAVRTGGTATIVGTNFGASQGTGGVTIGGVACSITSWSNTSIVVGIPSTLMFTGTKTVTVTPNAGGAGSRTGVNYLPPAGCIFERITAVPVPSYSMAAGITGLAVGDEVYLNATATRSDGSETATIAFNGTGNGAITISGVTVDGDYVISGIQVRDATDGADTSNGPKSITFDTTAPSGYAVNVTQTAVSNYDSSLIDFAITGAEVGSTYNYLITSSGGGTPLTGSGTVSGTTQSFSGISIAALPNGTVTVSVALTDTNGNIGAAATDTVLKFSTPVLSLPTPSGSQGITSSVNVGATSTVNTGTAFYVADTVSLAGITAPNIRNGKLPGGVTNAAKAGSHAMTSTALAAVLSSLTPGTWTVCWVQNNNGGAVNGDSNIVSATFTIAQPSLSAGLPTGTISSHNSVTPRFTTNTAGGSAVGVMDIVARISSITIAQVKAAHNNLDGAPVKVLAAITPISGANSFAAQSGLSPDTDYSVAIVHTVNGIDSLLTFSFKTATSPVVTPPSGYAISFGQSVINNANKAAASVIFANAEVGAGYAVQITSSGGGSAVNRSGTITLAGQTIGGIDLSGLSDGTLSVSATLTNSGGAGAAAGATVPKRATLPVITLLGTSPMTVAVGGTFADPGASAVDSLGANISSGIVATGAVNTSAIGPYTRIYNVTDQWGNAAAQVTRTINVADQTKPVITLIGANPMTVTRASAFVDPGATAFDNYDGDITANIAVTGSVDSNSAATYQLVYSVSDSAGNVADSVIRIVNVVDSGGPLIANGGDKIVRLVPPLASIAKSDPQIANWIALFTATSNGVQLNVANDCPATLSIDHGPYSITFSTVDGLGQTGIRTVLLTIAVQNTDGGAITTLKLTNNAVTKFAGAVSKTQTVVSITPSDGAKFPVLVPNSGEWFPLVAIKANGQREIMRCTARANDLLTVSRAQEGTQALSFIAGELLQLRLTAGALSSFMAELESDVAGHTLNRSNPHEVRLAQLPDAGTAAARDTGTVDGAVPLYTANGISNTGIGGQAENKGIFDADNAPMGACLTVVGTVADCAANHWPLIEGVAGTPLTFDIFTYGIDTRRMQEATLINGAAPRIFRRTRTATTWTAWNELMTYANENFVGLVSYFAARSPKAGWLAINNGSTQYSRTTYKRLWDHLQDENLVGALAGPGDGSTTFTLWDDGSLFWRAHDVSNAHGNLFELRDDTIASHKHRTLIPQDEHGSEGAFPYNPEQWGSVGSSGDSGRSLAIVTDVTGGEETAPVHRNYLPCIKY